MHGLGETLMDYSLLDVNFAVTCNLQRTTKYLYKKYSSIWYLYNEAEILIDWLSYDTQREKY